MKEERYMGTIKAIVSEEDEKFYIDINAKSTIRIPITEDNPNEVKESFNSLIKLLKNGLFDIKLEGDGSDLIWNVANEYIAQLNEELAEIYEELKHYNLID